VVFMLLAMFLGVLHHRLDQRSIAEDANRRAEEERKAKETPATTEPAGPKEPVTPPPGGKAPEAPETPGGDKKK
jgi:hypothetical protein